MDLEAVKQSLLEQKNKVLGRVEALEADIQHRNFAPEADSGERALQMENDEVLDRLDEASLEELGDINTALDRIEKGVYQTCGRCGADIGEDRLKALPTTDRCVHCA